MREHNKGSWGYFPFLQVAPKPRRGGPLVPEESPKIFRNAGMERDLLYSLLMANTRRAGMLHLETPDSRQFPFLKAPQWRGQSILAPYGM